MRILFRIFSIMTLAIAIIVGVVDALQSVVIGELNLTPLGQTWAGFHPSSLELVSAVIKTYLIEEVWDPTAQWVLVQPSSVVFLTIAFLFYALSYKRERPEDRFLIR